MIQPRRSEDRGHADHGWLQTWHTFSFAGYHDADFMGFGALRVLNQDIVQPGRGFGTHPHDNMEIVTYVLEGVLEHEDSMGTGSRILPGEVQLMSAGTGVTHSEFNGSKRELVHLLQMWVIPSRRNTKPRYAQRAFPEEELSGALRLVVSPDGADGSLAIGQDARLFAGRLDAGDRVRQEMDSARRGWLHVATGEVTLNGERLGPGDGAAIAGEGEVALEGVEAAELVLWDLP
jgi:hypothetical protein